MTRVVASLWDVSGALSVDHDWQHFRVHRARAFGWSPEEDNRFLITEGCEETNMFRLAKYRPQKVWLEVRAEFQSTSATSGEGENMCVCLYAYYNPGCEWGIFHLQRAARQMSWEWPVALIPLRSGADLDDLWLVGFQRLPVIRRSD